MSGSGAQIGMEAIRVLAKQTPQAPIPARSGCTVAVAGATLPPTAGLLVASATTRPSSATFWASESPGLLSF